MAEKETREAVADELDTLTGQLLLYKMREAVASLKTDNPRLPAEGIVRLSNSYAARHGAQLALNPDTPTSTGVLAGVVDDEPLPPFHSVDQEVE